MGVSLTAVRERSRVRVTTLTNDPPEWTFDVPAILRACERLGVEGTIALSVVRYARGRWGGMYYGEGRAHAISVPRWHDANGASRVLWHELTHALQEERGDREPTQHLRGDAYWHHPSEVEARANEYLGDAYPLVVSARG